jgi:hypothetical protein
VENAASLQRMLEIMFSTILETNAEAASAHENSLQLISRRAESELSIVMTAMASAVASASTLHNKIVRAINNIIHTYMVYILMQE